MKQLKSIIVALLVISFPSFIYAQPSTTKEDIPINISSDVRLKIEKLLSTDPSERAIAAYDLGFMEEKAKDATPYLIDLLNDHALARKDLGLKWVPCKKKHGGQICSPELGWPVSPAGQAAYALGLIGAIKAVEPLILALDTKDWWVRTNAAWSLGMLGDKRAVEPLIARLQIDGCAEQSFVAWALGRLKDVRAVEPLIKALKGKKCETSSETISDIVWALGELGDSRAIELLIDNLSGEDDVPWHSAGALIKITGKDLGMEKADWLSWWEENKDKYPEK